MPRWLQIPRLARENELISKPALMLKCLDSFAITDRIMLQPVYPLKYFNVYYVYCLDQKVLIESFQWNNCSYI